MDDGGGVSIPTAPGGERPPGTAAAAPPKRSPIPPKYQDPDTSGLVYTIPSGAKQVEMTITLE